MDEEEPLAAPPVAALPVKLVPLKGALALDPLPVVEDEIVIVLELPLLGNSKVAKTVLPLLELPAEALGFEPEPLLLLAVILPL